MTSPRAALPGAAVRSVAAEQPSAAVDRPQTLTIENWLPAALSNGPHGHWSQRQKKLQAAQIMVWAAAKQEGLRPVEGRVKVTITLVFAQKRRRDQDNLVARCKGLLDGLVKGGWITDDSTEWLELVVLDAVSMFKQKATRITLEPAAVQGGRA